MQEHTLETIDPKILGQRLQNARKARGLTQQDVAKDLGIARTTVTAIEQGERRVRPARDRGPRDPPPAARAGAARLRAVPEQDRRLHQGRPTPIAGGSGRGALLRRVGALGGLGGRQLTHQVGLTGQQRGEDLLSARRVPAEGVGDLLEGGRAALVGLQLADGRQRRLLVAAQVV
jgi:hypothetical protein